MKLQEANLQVQEKNSFTYPLSYNIFCLHFLRTNHNYFFQRGFESVRAKFLSGIWAKNTVVLLVIYLFYYDSSKSISFIVECGI